MRYGFDRYRYDVSSPSINAADAIHKAASERLAAGAAHEHSSLLSPHHASPHTPILTTTTTDEKMIDDRMERVSSSLVSPTAPLSSPEWSHAWNDRFVRALELDDIHQRSEIITELSTDFVRIAKICGRLIIAELFQSPSRQTLAKKTIGGVAGGDKFIVQGSMDSLTFFL
jgi:hypothetical protein